MADSDDEVTEIDRDEFQRALTSVRSSARETDFSVITRENLQQTLANLGVALNEGMVTSFWTMIAAQSNMTGEDTLPADIVFSGIDRAANGDYKGMPLYVAIGGNVQEFKSSAQGRMLKHQQSMRASKESATASRAVEKRRMAELRKKREERERLRAEEEARKRKLEEEQALLDQARREEEARVEALRREEEAREEEVRQQEEIKRRLKIRAARERAASIDPAPRSPAGGPAQVRGYENAAPTRQDPAPGGRQRRSSISKLRDDQIVTSVGPIRSPAATPAFSKRMSNNLHSAPLHMDPSNIPSYEEKENDRPRKNTYDKNGQPYQAGMGLVRSSTPPQSDHLLSFQHQHTTSSHDRDEVPHRIANDRARHHRRESSRQSVASHNRQNTATSNPATQGSTTGSAAPSVTGADLKLNPAQTQTLHRVHAGLEYLQQMERDRWRQQNMLIDSLRDTESWKEISASVVETKLNNLKKDLSEMFEAQSLASAHRVAGDLSRELRNVIYGLNVLGEKVDRNAPQRELMEEVLGRVNDWTQLLQERWAVLNVNKYSRDRLSESHEEFRGEVLSSLDWVVNKSRETRRVITDQLAGDIGNKVLQLLDAFKLTKDGHVKFEAGQMDEDDELVVPVSHVTGLIEKHQHQHNEEVAVLNQRIASLEDSVDEFETKEKRWNNLFKTLRGENKDMSRETERLRARIATLEAEMEAREAVEKAKAKASLTERQQAIQDVLDDREEKLLQGESELFREREVFDDRFEMWDSNRKTFETMVQNHLENAKELTQNASDYNDAIENESDVALSNWAFNNKLLQNSTRSAEKKLQKKEREMRRDFDVLLKKRLKQQYEKLRRSGRATGSDDEDGDEKVDPSDTNLAVETDEDGKVLSFNAERKKHAREMRQVREQVKTWQNKALDVEQQLITARDTIIHLQKGIDVRNNVTTDMLKANIDLNVLTEQKRRLIKRLQTIYRTHLKHRDQFDLDALYKSRRSAELDRLNAEDEKNRRLLAEADEQLKKGLTFLDDPEQITNSRHQGMAGILQLIHVDKYDMRNVCLMGARFLIGIFSQLYASGNRTLDPKMLYNAYRIVTVSFDSFQAQKGNDMNQAVVTFGREAIEQYRWWRLWTHDWQSQTKFSGTFIQCMNRPRNPPNRPDQAYQPQTLEFKGATEQSFYRTRGMFFEGKIIANPQQSRFYTGSRSKRSRRDKSSGRSESHRDRGADPRESTASNVSATSASTPDSSAPATPNSSRSRSSAASSRATTG